MIPDEARDIIAPLLARLGLDDDALPSGKKKETLTGKIKKLRLEINRHRQLYYDKAAPEISDTEFDLLLKYLEELERRRETKKPRHRRVDELALDDSPTAQIGADHAAGFREVAHRQKMLSLDNTYNEEEVRAFHSRLVRLLGTEDLHYTVEPKIDGLAISLTYEQGKFVRAVTRGKGDKGDDVTVNVLTIQSLPRELQGGPAAKIPDIVEIRGEIYLTAAEFERINAERAAAGEELYANPRNTAAGTIKQLDSTEVARRKLSIVLYSLGHCEPAVVATQAELHGRLQAWGLPGVERIWHVRGIDAAWAAIGELDQLRRGFAYGTDGAVVKLDDMALQAKAGVTAKAPSWAIAYKYKADTVRTRLEAITIQVGKTGILSPVAELNPVFLAGSTISRATLHNEDEIRRKDIRVGDLVEIEKAGEVIPAVLRSFPEERPAGATEFDLPAAVGNQCPVCGGRIAKIEVAAEEAQGVAWKCQNYDCRAQRAGRLEFFCSRKALEIDSVGEIVAAKLVERALVKDQLDIYAVSEQELAALNLGTDEKKRILGELVAKRIIQAREKARGLSLAKWLYALSIPDVGEETARDIAKIHESMEAVASSRILRSICELARVNDEILKNSPQAKANKTKSTAEREAMKPIWKGLIEKADMLGERLISEKVATRTWKLPREARILVENPETAEFKRVLEALDASSTSSQKVSGEEDAKKMKAAHERAKKEADRLGERLIQAGYAERSPQPFRSASTVIGSIAARSTIEWFESDVGRRFLNRLVELGISPKGNVLSHAEKVQSEFSGKTVVLTGTLESMSRPDAQDRIRALGGNVTTSVSKNTDMLVAGPGAGSKLEEARKHGVRIIEEPEFLIMLGEGGSTGPELQLQ